MDADRKKSEIDRKKSIVSRKVKSGGYQMMMENLREKQAKAREAREDRQMQLTGDLYFMMELAASFLNVELKTMEEGVLDSDRHIKIMNSLLVEGGRQAIMFYFMEYDVPGVDSGRYLPGAPKPEGITRRVMVTDGSDIPYSGACVICFRLNSNININVRNIHEEVFFATFDVAATLGEIDTNPVSVSYNYLKRIHMPVLSVFANWGELSKSEQGRKDKQDFLDSFSFFLNFLSNTKLDLQGRVDFSIPSNIVRMLANRDDVEKIISNPTTLVSVEGAVNLWATKIEKVLTQSQQIRSEADDVGPFAELEHWRRLLAKFTSIIEFIKTDESKNAVQCLINAKSKVLKKWKLMDNRITDACNEARDNVKYLYSLEKFCEPLYRCEPPKMKDYIPSLLYTIRMIFNTSRYYNTNERLTAIFVKVTNQMVKACRGYLTNNGKIRVFDQPKHIMIRKMSECLDLYAYYSDCFRATKKKVLETPDEKPFECSDMFIFGKFETFRKRLEKLIDVFSTVATYSVLRTSQIEGIEAFANRISAIVKVISSKPYDTLDHRRDHFDKDYEEFRRSLAEIETDFRQFTDRRIKLSQETLEAIKCIERFEKLHVPCLNITQKYIELYEKFYEELMSVRTRYNENKSNPNLHFDAPPVAGRIMWARALYSRIEEPMMLLKEREDVITVKEARRVVRVYNNLAEVLVHYELLYYNAWCKQVYRIQRSLQAPVLVKHKVTQVPIVNFDIYVFELIEEVEKMWTLQLEVPAVAQIVTFCKDKILNAYENIKALVQRLNKLRNSIPDLLLPLMRSQYYKLDKSIQPGFTIITWTSLKINEFCSNIKEILQEVEIFCKEVYDMMEARVEGSLESIASTLLIVLPEDSAITVGEFTEVNRKHRAQVGRELQIKSQAIEDSVIELINTCLSAINQPEIEDEKYNWMDPDAMQNTLQGKTEESNAPPVDYNKLTDYSDIRILHKDCLDLYGYFNQKNLESLIKATRQSLEVVKKRVMYQTALTFPLFKCDLILKIPNTEIKPTIDEMQSTLTKVVISMLDAHRTVKQWGERQALKKQLEGSLKDGKGVSVSFSTDTVPYMKMKNYFKSVADHKEVQRSIMLLQSSIGLLRQDIAIAVEKYLKYSFLWVDDREDRVVKFITNNPELQSFKEEFQKYEGFEQEIQALPEFVIVSCIEVCTDMYKLGLKVEAKAWKVLLAKYIELHYRQKMDETINFILENMAILERPIKDLEDVRRAMACLDTIREEFISIDASLFPIEETYTTLLRFGCDVPKEQSEKVYTLRYNFQKLVANSQKVQNDLVLIQEPFKLELLDAVKFFQENLAEFDEDYEAGGPMIPGITPREASDRLIVFQNRFDELWRKYVTYSAGEKLFGLPVNEYPNLLQRKRELNLLQKLYGLYNTVMESIDGYYDIPWVEIDIEKINNELVEFQNRCKKLPKGMMEWQAYLDLKKKIDDFNETCPLLEMMSNKAMKDRHWERIGAATKFQFEIDSPNFLLRNVMEAPLLKHKDEVEDICISAVKEKDIEAKLKQVIADWATVELSFSAFKSRGELLLKGTETQEIIALSEDSLMVLGSLLSNRYNAPFKKSIQLWVSRLTSAAEILEYWLITQNLWVYLEAVFVGGDIAKQLPAEAKKFQGIDKTWVQIMGKAHETPNVIDCCCGNEALGELLPHLLQQLETCQKSLTGYLEAKRMVFPRFFFVSDPALLEILGQASDSHTIQHHLVDVFENVARVEFHEKDYDRMLSVFSRENEKIKLEKEVLAFGGVEVWLGELLKQQQLSLHGVIRDAASVIEDPDFSLLEIIEKFPAQVGLLSIQIIWTREAERALVLARTLKAIMKLTNQKFLDMLNLLIDQTTKNLTKFERVKFETLVTIHVHQRDIFDELVKKGIKTLTDFEWLKQARFYFFEDTDECLVKITDVDFIYQNEFLGNTDRLVITPLTDRCYITLAQACGMSMGGAPAGPAGTGKTETTKDMGKALGKYVVVFNCSDQMDYKGLGRIYKGLAQSGSWGCFDEFNRIELPVLSVAAEQISIVFTAKRDKKASFVFGEDVVDLNNEVGIFITMNPGYAGRQELPENLKIMFRTVAMMVPDRQIIMRVKLASCGFKDNINLARKFFVLYKLCEEQLSKQVHYDFGLRNILSVLRTLGAQKRARPQEGEETVVMRVLRDMNLSKLVDEDEPLFISLIGDLFPGIVLEKATWAELQQAVGHQVEIAKLVNHPGWNLKVVQLYETHLVRHGLMTLGPTGAGKSCCINILMRAMTENGRPHREMRMNPKAITAPQMFGRLDAATNDWTDGIFSTLWRRSLKIKPTDFVWIVLDGPVDAVWIENLNSVLDDNQLLTLANGDRIKMSPNSKLLFEPDNVDNASPATVSRVGMVFMSASVLTWDPVVKAWGKTKSKQEADILLGFFDKIFEDLLVFVRTRLSPKMNILESMYIRQCTDLLDGLIGDREDGGILPADYLERLFLYSLMWSLGAVLELADRSKMETFVLAHESKLSWPKVMGDQTIFEFVVNDHGLWEHWSNRVEEFIYPSDSILEYTSILVPNVDNVRSGFMIDLIAKQYKGVLLIGEQGTAKTIMIKASMDRYDPEAHLKKSMNFSSATTPEMFQRSVESYIDKRVGTTYGPPGGRKMTIFIDDINMPIINEWGDQVTNEIVRQLMEQGGFYSLDKPGDFSTIVDIQFIAAMIHPGGGRNDIPPRLKRRFNIFNCTLPSNNSMDKIFGAIGSGYFCSSRFNEEVVELIPKLVPVTRRLWQQTKIKMLPTPAKFHYVFNLRDLSRIWEGILHIAGEECQKAETVLKLWQHECTRVIADRFTNAEDKVWFEKKLREITDESFSEEYEHSIPQDTTYFVDFLREPPEPTGDEEEDFSLEAPKIYEEIPSYKFVTDKTLEYMRSLNEVTRGLKMDMVFFRDALVHLMIISRIVRTPRGSALLVGVGGSGKQSLTKLASFIAGYKTFQITLTRAYSNNNLLDDLKYLYRVSGFDGRGISFIFTDNEVKDESFLEYINNILSSGEVANLFPKDEREELLQELIPAFKKELPKAVISNDNLYEFFISRARNNLHVVLCFSPVGGKFRSRSLKFPALISGCTIDWFQRWPKDALLAVSEHYLGNYDMVATAETKSQLIDLMANVHDEVADYCVKYFDRFRRQTFVTPKSYLSFLEGYKVIYSEKRHGIGVLAERMNVGLQKLLEAAENVAELSKVLEVKNKEAQVATLKANKVLEEVAVVAQAAELVKADVQVVKDRAENLVRNIGADKAVALRKLAAAKPALEAAEAALGTIKAGDIATVRKLGKPPFLITVIMDVVLILFKKYVEPVKMDMERKFLVTSWGESLKFMSASSFLQQLQQFPKDLINGETVDLMTPYLTYDLYTLEAALSACGNVAGLLQWTVAMASFYSVNKEVLPLKANLAIQENRLAKANKQLAEAEALLADKEASLAEANVKFEIAAAEKQLVVDEAQRCQNKMNAATDLIQGLSGERVRWTEQSKLFKEQTERLVGDVLFLTGFLSYSGPFNQEFRNNLQENWTRELLRRQIPLSANLNLIEMLIDSTLIAEWNLQGLPNDELSIQNGIIVTKAQRYPLLIDPQNQGKVWIKNKEANFEMQVTTLNHKYFRTHIEDALSLGRPLLIEDVQEDLDPCLDNVLEKNFIKSGTSLKVKVSDKEVDIMQGFKLYITTKLPNPSYTPEIYARTSIIDFTVTMKGLEDQLLGRVIITEKSELETERTMLIEDVTMNKRKMQELEANLLHKLTTTEGSLLDDDTVIGTLNVTKNTAAEVKEKLVIAADTEIKINAAREEFRNVANRGSILYFLVCDMSMVNCMYQISLVQFLELFDNSMLRSEKSPITFKRVAFIVDYLTYEVYRYTTRGLYEEHKFLFTVLMALKIDLNRKRIAFSEFENFIKGGAALDLNAVQAKACRWITDMTWLNLVQLSTVHNFEAITHQVATNEKAWRAWFDTNAPEEAEIPDGYGSLDPFRRLLLIRAWCPDRTIAQSRKYVADSLDERFTKPVILDMEGMWGESRFSAPMVGLLSMGSDPTQQIETLAKKLNYDLRAISMGQGQEDPAQKSIDRAAVQGSWVLLQNCHLGLDYILALVVYLTETPNIHENFRLWITTEVHPKFPITFLQLAVKYTNDPPQGVKAGLKRTFSGITQEFLEYTEYPQYHPLLYGVSFLHTVVQERRKFGPLGWNIPYEFNSADWYASVLFMQKHLDDMDPKKGVNWNTVRYMLGEIQYGGRVTDDFDKRLLNTFAKVWFSENLFREDFLFYDGYGIPRRRTVVDYLKVIDELPSVDPPQVYGLHANADITYQTNFTKDMLDTIVSIQPKESSAGGGETRESIVNRQATDMLSKLPKDYDPYEVKDRLKEMGQYKPMNIFLRQEIDRMQKVIKLVRSTLKDLQLAIEGTIIMNEALRDALDNIYDARVPANWKRGSWASTTLGFWFTELLERNTQFSSWIFQGRPAVFWMTGFFNPQGFLTAMRQEITRANTGWSLDFVTLDNEVLKQNKEDIRVGPPSGVYVHGLFLDGASWDRKNSRLTESTPKVLSVKIPVVRIFAVYNAGPKGNLFYQCPVYKKPNRTDLMYVTSLWLPSPHVPPEHWVLRGVALLCDNKG